MSLTRRTAACPPVGAACTQCELHESCRSAPRRCTVAISGGVQPRRRPKRRRRQRRAGSRRSHVTRLGHQPRRAPAVANPSRRSLRRGASARAQQPRRRRWVDVTPSAGAPLFSLDEIALHTAGRLLARGARQGVRRHGVLVALPAGDLMILRKPPRTRRSTTTSTRAAEGMWQQYFLNYIDPGPGAPDGLRDQLMSPRQKDD